MNWDRLREMLAMGAAGQAPAGNDAVAKLARVLGPALADVGQTEQRQGRPWRSLERFGGHVLGFGKRKDGEQFATVFRGGKLWHVDRDGGKLKIDDGAVARAFGIRPKLGAIEAVQGRGGLEGADTGGIEAPAAPTFPRQQVPAYDPDQDPASVKYSRGPLDVERLRALGLL